jgi:hypothetical protein
VSSQGGEDAILERLFARIGTTNKLAVDVGARDGVSLSNTYNLERRHGWKRILFDARPKAPQVHPVRLTVANIDGAFVTYGVPPTVDLLSIDVDGNDFHLWKALTVSRPRVVVIEYNAGFGPHESVVIPYRADHWWDKTSYYGASAAALAKLGREKGYSLVDFTPGLNLVFAADEAWLPPAQPTGQPPCGPDRRWEVY